MLARLSLALSAVLLLAGCRRPKPVPPEPLSPALATAILDHYYDTEPPCLWFTPLALPNRAVPDPKTLAQFNALAGAGVLARTAGESRFTLAPAGQAAFRLDTDHPGFGNLCFGLSRVSHIDSTERRHDDTFGDVTDVLYTVNITQAPSWTRNVAVQNAFPLMALQLRQPLPHSATLKDTETGWRIAAAPADALPSAP